MKRISSAVIKPLVAIFIGSGALAGNLQAQSDLSVTATVSFPFTIDNQTIAPGTYRFSPLPGRVETSQFLLSVVDVKTDHMKIFPMLPERQRSIEKYGRLVFHNAMGRSFLGEIYFPGTDTFVEVLPGHPAETKGTQPSVINSAVSVAQR